MAGGHHPRRHHAQAVATSRRPAASSPRYTTSIPEAPGSGRTWDYRYCWLRDAYFVVKALNRIGATQTMEDFISFTLGIASNPDELLRPVYSVVPTDPLDEWTAPDLAGLSRRRAGADRQCGGRPGAARHLWQHHPGRDADVLRSPAAAPGRRRPVPAARDARRQGGASSRFEPDAGIWEYRGRKRIHTHSAAMCWAGCHRLAAIAARLGLKDRAAHWNRHRRSDPRRRCWSAPGTTSATPSPRRSAPTTSTPACCCCPSSACVEPDDPRFIRTVAAMERELVREKHVMRYASADDFGLPVTAFLICRFWLIDAWWSLGRHEEARELFEDALAHRNRFGLLSEDIDPQDRRAVGQFPADLFDGRADPHRDAPVAQLGGSILAVASLPHAPPHGAERGRRPRCLEPWTPSDRGRPQQSRHRARLAPSRRSSSLREDDPSG